MKEEVRALAQLAALGQVVKMARAMGGTGGGGGGDAAVLRRLATLLRSPATEEAHLAAEVASLCGGDKAKGAVLAGLVGKAVAADGALYRTFLPRVAGALRVWLAAAAAFDGTAGGGGATSPRSASAAAGAPAQLATGRAGSRAAALAGAAHRPNAKGAVSPRSRRRNKAADTAAARFLAAKGVVGASGVAARVASLGASLGALLAANAAVHGDRVYAALVATAHAAATRATSPEE